MKIKFYYLVLSIVCMAIVFNSGLLGVTVSVGPEGDYDEIWKALDHPHPDDLLIIEVDDGPPYPENLDFSDKHDIILRSKDGKDNCRISPGTGIIIFGNSDTRNIEINDFILSDADYCVAFSGGVSGINGIKITNCHILNCDKGIALASNASAEIDGCFFEGHFSPGGLTYAIDALNFSDIKVNNCEFRNINDGIHVRFNSTGDIKNTKIENCFYDGIYARTGSSVVIEDFECSSTEWGIVSLDASIYVDRCDLADIEWGITTGGAASSSEIYNTKIQNCFYAGITFSGGTGKAENVIISDSGQGYNGAIEVFQGPTAQIINALIYDNEFGVAVFAGNADIINCTITKNRYGVWARSMRGLPPAVVNIKNCIITKNTYGIDCDSRSPANVSYSAVFRNWARNCNYCSECPTCINWPFGYDPEFVDPDANDYHLQDISPCIDKGDSAGAPAVDVEGTFRPHGVEIDIGAYEYYSTLLRLIYPAKSAEISDPTPTFKWACPAEDNDKVLHYKLEIAKYDTPGINEVEVESKEDPAGFVPLPPLVPGIGTAFYTVFNELPADTYVWKVSAWNGTDYYLTSETRILTILPRP